MIRTNRFRRAAAFSVSAALVVLPCAARAEVPLQAKVYGFLNAEVERVSAEGGPTPYDARGRLSDGNSRIGIAGSVDFAPQTKAVWQLEGSLNSFEQSGVNDRGLSSVIVSRNTFAGVADDRFGTLVFGHNDSAYRSLVGSASALAGNLGLTVLGLDLWNNTSAQMSGNPDSVFSRGEARFKNSLHYASPDRMVRVAGSYSFDEAGTNGVRRDRYAVAARLKLGAFQLGGGFDYQGDTGANVDGLEQGLGLRTIAEDGVSTYFYKAVASYTLPTGTFLGVGFERSNYGFAQMIDPTASDPYARIVTGTMRQNGAMVSVAQPFGAAAVMASYGKLWKLSNAVVGSGGDYEASQLSVGARYAFGEHFAAYAYYTRIDNESGQDANLGQAPLYSNGLGTAGAYLAPGNSPRALGMGLIARF